MKKPQPAPYSVRIPSELEEGIQIGMERLGVKKHAYVLAAIRNAVKREKPIKGEK